MTETIGSLKIGQPVPDFELTTYDPVAKDFGQVKLAELKAQGKWTILFFYPADFTFV
jgi:peroxiredoxin (alkyl hydroperoxide reductase subunit C)